MKTTHEVIIFDEDDNEIFVTVVRNPGERGERDKYGVPMTPDDEVEYEIEAAVDEEGNNINLTEDQIAEARTKAEEDYDIASDESYDEDEDDDDDEV
jgi:hypothetical protein